MPPNKPPNARSTTSALLTALALSLTACATPSPPPPPCAGLKLPARPPLTQPTPPESYSQRVQRTLQTWREQLTATPATR